MCKYVINGDECKVTNERCPYMYKCPKTGLYKANQAMPDKCKVTMNYETPQGYYRVREERQGYLYVDIGDFTYKILNPFEEVPIYVRAYKTKTGWKLKK